jgi:hypothetical protein
MDEDLTGQDDEEKQRILAEKEAKRHEYNKIYYNCFYKEQTDLEKSKAK